MNPKFINAQFANAMLISYPRMVEWKSLEFFVFGEYLIKQKKHRDATYLNVIKSIASHEFACTPEAASELVRKYVDLISEEEENLTQFALKYAGRTPLATALEVYEDYGLEGMRLLAERKFTKRPVQLVERLLGVHASSDASTAGSLGLRFGLLGDNKRFAEMGLLVLKRRAYFGQNLSRELAFFLWFLNLAVDPEDYAVKYVATKSVDDLERAYSSYLKKSGGLHQTVVKLTREIRAGLRRFE
jgi:hypothetical protein